MPNNRTAWTGCEHNVAHRTVTRLWRYEREFVAQPIARELDVRLFEAVHERLWSVAFAIHETLTEEEITDV